MKYLLTPFIAIGWLVGVLAAPMVYGFLAGFDLVTRFIEEDI